MNNFQASDQLALAKLDLTATIAYVERMGPSGFSHNDLWLLLQLVFNTSTIMLNALEEAYKGIEETVKIVEDNDAI